MKDPALTTVPPAPVALVALSNVQILAEQAVTLNVPLKLLLALPVIVIACPVAKGALACTLLNVTVALNPLPLTLLIAKLCATKPFVQLITVPGTTVPEPTPVTFNVIGVAVIVVLETVWLRLTNHELGLLVALPLKPAET